MKRSKPYRFRHPKGRFIQVEFDFLPGKRISTNTHDMAEAVLFAEAYIRNGGMLMDRKEIPTLSAFSRDIFLRRDKDSIYAMDRLYNRIHPDSYYRNKQARLDHYIIPAFGSYLVTAISFRNIETWLPSLRSAKTGEPLSDNSRNKVLIVFRNLMDEVRRAGYRDDNPASEVSMIRETGKAREPLSDSTLIKLFPSDPDERIRIWGGEMWAVYFSIFYDTGMRPGEIAALRVCDIYRTPRGLAVGTMREVSTEYRRIIERIKTTDKGLRKRSGLLYDDTASLLLRYIDRMKLKDEDLLFKAPARKDGLLFPETSNKHFKSVLARFGCYEEGMVQYCLRHTYETDRRGDMPDSLLALSMGHTKLRDDYDHQQTLDIIRRLDAERDGFFANRRRLGQEDDIVPLSSRTEEM